MLALGAVVVARSKKNTLRFGLASQFARKASEATISQCGGTGFLHCINSVQTSPRVKGQTGFRHMRARWAADSERWPETGRGSFGFDLRVHRGPAACPAPGRAMSGVCSAVTAPGAVGPIHFTHRGKIETHLHYPLYTRIMDCQKNVRSELPED